MADFRKWLLAFAVVALLLGTGVAQAQALTGCAVTPISLPFARAEGYTELTGGIQILCQGTATPAGTPIPTYDITVGLNTNITSRLYTAKTLNGQNATEARLTIDRTTVNYKECPDTTLAGTGCAVNGTGIGGANPYATGYNAFIGVNTATISAGTGAPVNSISFYGVPIDGPSTAGGTAHVVRIENIRADAADRSAGTTVGGPIPIVAYVSIAGVTGATTAGNLVPITTALPITVAYVVPGLTTSITGNTAAQCSAPAGPATVTIRENFAYAFKTKTNATLAASESGFTPASTITPNAGLANSGTRFLLVFRNLQNGVTLTVPGKVVSLDGNVTMYLVSGADQYGGQGTAPTTAPANVNVAGTFTNAATANIDQTVTYEVVSETNPRTPATIPITLTYSYTANPVGNVPYVTPPAVTDLYVTGKTPNTSLINVYFAPTAPSSVSLPSGSNAGQAWNLPQIGAGTAADPDYAWIPRFTYNQNFSNGLTISACTCNLLFPYVTAQGGYDTGIAVANTTMDPFGGGHTGQTGAVTFYFYGNSKVGTTNTATFSVPESAATKTLVVPPGCVLAFDLKSNFTSGGAAATLPGCATTNTASGGSAANNYLINGTATATPLQGFEGYVIATATFQYCHGEAFILNGASGGAFYNAIELDTPFWAQGITGVAAGRTGQFGESQGN